MISLLLSLLLHAAPPQAALGTVVLVSTPKGRGGLATPISPQLAMTAHHLVKDDPEVRWSGGTARGSARVVAVFPKKDIAFIKVEEGVDFPSWVPVAGRTPALLEEVFYLAPDGTGKLATIRGEVNVKRDDGRWGIAAYGFFGASGGGVFSAKGELLAVVSQLGQSIVEIPEQPPFFSQPIVIVVEVRGLK